MAYIRDCKSNLKFGTFDFTMGYVPMSMILMLGMVKLVSRIYYYVLYTSTRPMPLLVYVIQVDEIFYSANNFR
jgi:hypothetical protein